ncbi:MAG: Glucose--fructose oxidoreductase [Deltaproteobacteria bacterium]|jgi:predicted dehydrogenase|nr:Glucose--fructose oxidoreductase [Deltaproteobacteria bacterium]
MKKLRWGILSPAKIGMEKVIPAMQQGEHSEIAAIASRNTERARAAAAKLRIPKAYGTYEELLGDTSIDAVYIPLPNHLHVPWTIKALKAGKHVLCEKPIALTASEAEELLEETRKHPQLKVMEAFMYRHHPQWLRALELINEGGIGDVKTVHSFFSYYNDDPGNIRNMAEIGGGGLMDIGCYCISLARLVFDSEPQKVLGKIEYDPQFRTDRLCSGILDFGNGTSTFTCSTQLVPYQRVNIFGTEGRVEIEIPFNAPPDKPCRMLHQRQDKIEEIELEICDQYTIQGDLFSLAVLNDTEVPTPLEDAVGNMRVIEAVIKSADEEGWRML